jgi:hypothetical protein
VHRLLTAHGAPTIPAGTSEPDARAFTHPHANDLWTSDVMHGPHLLAPGRNHGNKTYLLAVLDDATRMVPFAAFYASENAACFQDSLTQNVPASIGRPRTASRGSPGGFRGLSVGYRVRSDTLLPGPDGRDHRRQRSVSFGGPPLPGPARRSWWGFRRCRAGRRRSRPRGAQPGGWRARGGATRPR